MFSFKEFLESKANKNTRKQYKVGITAFCRWFSKTPEEVLEMRRDDLTPGPNENPLDFKYRSKRFERKLEKFWGYLTEEEGKATNTAREYCNGIKQLFRYYEMGLNLRDESPVKKRKRSSRSFPLRIEHVRRMFKVANQKQRVVLSMATDLGLRINDFLKIKIEDLPELDKEPPIPFHVETQKEEIPAHSFLSAETAELLKDWIETLKHKGIENPYLFPSNASRPMSDEAINKMLRTLAEKAGIKLNGKRLTFHCFRKMFLSSSVNVGLFTAGKKLVGKAIPQSDDTYLTTVKLREAFIQIKKQLTIRQVPKPKDHEELKAVRASLNKAEEELAIYKTRLDEIHKQLTQQTETIEVLRKEEIAVKERIFELENVRRTPFEEELLKALERPQVRESFLKWLGNLAEKKDN